MLTKHTHDIIETNFRKNFSKEIPAIDGYPAFTHISSAYYSRPKFIKLSAETGIGKILIHILNNPNRTHNQILDDLNYSQLRETWQYLIKAELITNSNKPGYTITDLGKSVLKQFNLI